MRFQLVTKLMTLDVYINLRGITKPGRPNPSVQTRLIPTEICGVNTDAKHTNIQYTYSWQANRITLPESVYKFLWDSPTWSG